MARNVLNGLNIAGGNLTFGTAADVNLYRHSASELRTDDSLITGNRISATDTTHAIDFAVSGGTAYLQVGPFGSGGAIPLSIQGMFGSGGDYAYFDATKMRVPTGTITFGNADDTNLYRAAADHLKTDDLLDASTAGLRTKHESAATPSGGNSGEVRVGTDKIWFQDAGTWKSVAPAGASSTPFATLAKFGTD